MAEVKSLDDVQAAVRAELVALQPMLTEAVRKAAIDAVREALTSRTSDAPRPRRPTPPHRSAAEWATLRRGEIAALAAHVEALPAEMNDDTFASYAEPIESRLREVIQRLGDAERVEGNTLMILDQLLETLLNDERGRAYRREETRAAVVALLNRLATAEKVTPEDARNSYRALKLAGLNPAAPLTLVLL